MGHIHIESGPHGSYKLKVNFPWFNSITLESGFIDLMKHERERERGRDSDFQLI